MVRPQASFDVRRPRDIFWMITNLPIITGLYLVMRTLWAHYVQAGDARVIRPVLMVRARVCHWVMTIKSPLIAADHCWLLWCEPLSPQLSHLTLVAVQCPVRECGGPLPAESPARARLPGASTVQPGQEPSPLLSSLSVWGWHWPLTLESTLLTTHEPQPMKFSGLPTPAQQPATPATILDRTECRERWVGRQLGQRKLASNQTCHQTSKVLSFSPQNRVYLDSICQTTGFPSTFHFKSQHIMLQEPLPTTLQGFLFNKWPAHYAYRFLFVPQTKLARYWGLRGLGRADTGLGGDTWPHWTQCWTSDQIWVNTGQHKQSFVNENLYEFLCDLSRQAGPASHPAASQVGMWGRDWRINTLLHGYGDTDGVRDSISHCWGDTQPRLGITHPHWAMTYSGGTDSRLQTTHHAITTWELNMVLRLWKGLERASKNTPTTQS